MPLDCWNAKVSDCSFSTTAANVNPGEQRALNIVAAVGLGVGGVFGMAGTLVETAPLRQALWAIDGVGLVVASALLTVKYFKEGNDWVAAGFLVFAIGESLLLSGTAAGLSGSVPSFGGGVVLWAAALLLTSIPRQFAGWVRVVGVLAATLFAIVAGRIFRGGAIAPHLGPPAVFRLSVSRRHLCRLDLGPCWRTVFVNRRGKCGPNPSPAR